MMRPRETTSAILLSLLIFLSHAVVAEIIELDILIDASSDEVHFVRGFLQAPASIDLTAVKFITTAEPEFLYGDDEFNSAADDELNNNDGSTSGGDVGNEGDDDNVPDTTKPAAETEPPNGQATASPTAGRPASVPTKAPTANKKTTAAPTSVPKNNGSDGTGGSSVTAPTPTPGNAATASPSNGNGDRQRARLADKAAAPQIFDLVLFQVPADCKKDAWGTCDWATLGVGVHDSEMEGGMSYCCSNDTANRGLCDKSLIGTLIVDHALLKGDHRKIEVPNTPDTEFSMKNPTFEVAESGDYVLVIANCDDYGLEILALGNMEWKSVGGYLPGDMFGLMFFYAALACIYFVLTLWYYCGMKMFQDAAIPIQKYILATMILGLFEVSFRGIDLYVWNVKGLRSNAVTDIALILGVLKQGSSRCLGVMVSMGWGVVRDSLGTTLVKIASLGLLYSGLALARDFLVVAAEEVEKVSLTEEEELVDLALVLTPLIIIVNLIFYFWIIASLNSTTEYLRNMNQTSKLKRHMQLRCLILTSLFVVGVWLLLSVVQVFTNFLSQDQIWVMEAVMHANYLFILFGVAILWRPTSTSKDYAMQMEIPSLGGDDNELELSCVVPSADDLDYDNGNDPDHPNGLRINGAVAS